MKKKKHKATSYNPKWRVWKLKIGELSVGKLPVWRDETSYMYTYTMTLDSPIHKAPGMCDHTGNGDSLRMAFRNLKISLAAENNPAIKRAHERMMR